MEDNLAALLLLAEEGEIPRENDGVVRIYAHSNCPSKDTGVTDVDLNAVLEATDDVGERGLREPQVQDVLE